MTFSEAQQLLTGSSKRQDTIVDGCLPECPWMVTFPFLPLPPWAQQELTGSYYLLTIFSFKIWEVGQKMGREFCSNKYGDSDQLSPFAWDWGGSQDVGISLLRRGKIQANWDKLTTLYMILIVL